MNKPPARPIIFRIVRGSLLVAALLLTVAGPAMTGQIQPELAKQVGDKVPLFAVATSQGTLADYKRDYYGRHHLVLTFFPAAFTPV